MILIITHKEDVTADFVINKMNKGRVDYYRFNCEDILTKNNISIQIEDTFLTKINTNTDFKSVWFRRTKYPNLEDYDINVQRYCLEEINAFFTNLWLSINSEKWLSNPEKVYKAENKLLQLRLANKIGFKIPKTLVTGNHVLIHDFYLRHNGHVILKPIYNNRFISGESQSLIFTNKLMESDLENLDKRLPLPCIFQEYIEKRMEYRVTIVGDEVFTASIDSQSDEMTQIDWRKKKLKFQPAIIPNQIKDLCLKMLLELGISFGAFDLIQDKNGDFYFLEINPNGQWAWIEIDTGLKISDSIIKFLK